MTQNIEEFETEENQPIPVLVAVEQKEVLFYDDDLTAIKANDGQIYVSIRHVCQVLDIDDNAQRQRIRRHTILDGGLMVCNLHTIQGARETYVLRVDLLPLWLAGIRTKLVRPEVKAKLERFQRESAKVLWEAFQDGRLTTAIEPAFEELLQSGSLAAEAYKTARALMQLAQNQLLMEAQLQVHTSRLDGYERRLDQIEQVLNNPGRYITPEQASQISQAVKAIAMKLGEKTKKNEYGGVYGELYRQFGITSYKLLPAGQFELAMKLLNEWYQQLTSDLPF